MRLIGVDIYMLDFSEYGWLWLCGKNTAQLGFEERSYEFWLLGISVALMFETTEAEALAWLKKKIER